jgi:hypothetical protein
VSGTLNCGAYNACCTASCNCGSTPCTPSASQHKTLSADSRPTHLHKGIVCSGCCCSAVEPWAGWFVVAAFAGILMWEQVWDLPGHAALSGVPHVVVKVRCLLSLQPCSPEKHAFLLDSVVCRTTQSQPTPVVPIVGQKQHVLVNNIYAVLSFAGWLLVLITSGAVACSVLFERRLWCRYLCPIGEGMVHRCDWTAHWTGCAAVGVFKQKRSCCA